MDEQSGTNLKNNVKYQLEEEKICQKDINSTAIVRDFENNSTVFNFQPDVISVCICCLTLSNRLFVFVYICIYTLVIKTKAKLS